MTLRHEETICAISTPLGQGAIGIVRLSGPEAFSIARSLFRPKGSSSRLPFNSHHLYYGHICDEGGRVVDEVLVSFMEGPHSYTREDVVEINCHGGSVALRMVLELAMKQGARLAQPGEFTKRAFMNGRIDLVQAEAVAEMIQARTNSALRAIASQLTGDFSKKIHALKESLFHLWAPLEASIDFPDEDIDLPSQEELFQNMQEAIKEIDELLRRSEAGILIREGLKVVLVGRPNVGKSSLFNALLGSPRAIVTPVPGTTRDVIEEAMEVDGIPIRLFDTAGMREVHDPVEEQGLLFTRRYIEMCQIILLVLDASQPLADEDRELFTHVNGKSLIIVANKSDLPMGMSFEEVSHLIQDRRPPVLMASALLGSGLEELKRVMVKEALNGQALQEEGALMANARQKEALMAAREALKRGQEARGEGLSLEFLCFDLKEALDCLGHILGTITTDDLLERVFSQFCIGK